MDESWDARFDHAIKNRYHTTESLPQLVQIVRTNKGLTRLFEDLGKNRSFQRLLFARPSELFEVQDDFIVAFLPHASKTKIRAGGKKGKIALTELLQDTSNPVSFPSLLSMNEQEWTSVATDVAEVVSYYILNFIRETPELRALILDDKFEYDRFQKALSGISVPRITGLEEATAVVLEVARETPTVAVHPAIAAKTKALMAHFIAKAAQSMDEVGLQMGKILPNAINSFHLVADVWVSRILARTGLSSTTYEEVLQLLFQRELIETRSVMTWCTNCSIDNPTFSHREGKISPARLSASVCWICGDQEDFGALYKVHEDLRKIMFYKDGLLSVYLAWLMDEQGVDYKAAEYSKTAENDFIVPDQKRGGVLLEVKMHRSRKDPKNIESSLSDALGQLVRHATALRAEGTPLRLAVLVWNQPGLEAKELTPHLRRHVAALDGLRVEVVAATGLSEWVKDNLA